MQHAIDAVAHAQLAIHRFDMDIGGAGFHRLGNDLVDQTDQWRFAGNVLEAFGVILNRGRG